MSLGWLPPPSLFQFNSCLPGKSESRGDDLEFPPSSPPEHPKSLYYRGGERRGDHTQCLGEEGSSRRGARLVRVRALLLPYARGGTTRSAAQADRKHHPQQPIPLRPAVTRSRATTPSVTALRGSRGRVCAVVNESSTLVLASRPAVGVAAASLNAFPPP